MKDNMANIGSPNGLASNGGGDPHLMHAFAASGFNVNALRRDITANGLLQKDEWKALDTTVIMATQKRLNGIADLRSAGLTYSLGSLGVLTAEWENASSMSDAQVDMAGETPGREDSVEFTTQGVPVPLIHKGFRINIRRLMAARNLGQSIDTTQAAVAARRVALKLEDILFNGLSLKNDGYNVYGYTTLPQRLRTNIGTAWDAASPTIVADVIHMIETAADAGFYGPFNLYVPSNYWAVLMEDYDTYKDGTWLDRLLMLPELQAVKVSDVMESDEVVLVQMTSDVVDLAIGQDVTTVEWNSLGGMVSHFKVMGAMIPRLKYTEDEDGATVAGIVHAFEASTSTTTTA